MNTIVGIPPLVTEETGPFWHAAQQGRLLVQRCESCGSESFPPRAMCRTCNSRQTSFVEITSVGHVYSFTINHQRWLPELEVPFVIALVEFAQHPGVRIAGRLRGCAHQEVQIGMQVEIGFEPGPGGFAIPSFVCADSGASSAPARAGEP